METSGKLGQAKQAVAQTTRDAASKIKSTASETAGKARQEAERYASEKRESAANRIGGYSSAIHDSARSLEEQDPNIAWFAHQAADRIQRVSDYVRSRDFSGLREDCCGVARRHPTAFFGGLFVAGLVIGNMMKATARPRHDDEGTFDYDDSDWRSEASDYAAGSSLQDELPMSSSPLPSTSMPVAPSSTSSTPTNAPGMSGM